LNRLNEANSAFQRGVEILETSERPGDRDYLLLNLTGLASLALEQGNPAQALSYVEKIWPLHFTNRPNFHEYYTGWSYLTCCQVFQANADPRAAEALAEAHEVLQERAARISDEEHRRSFLENVPWHREIIAMWKRRSQEETP
jgi:ATP/maltotriose-dependent transcriptional regulator MalT